MYACMFVYIYIICMYIYVHVHIYTHTLFVSAICGFGSHLILSMYTYFVEKNVVNILCTQHFFKNIPSLNPKLILILVLRM